VGAGYLDVAAALSNIDLAPVTAGERHVSHCSLQFNSTVGPVYLVNGSSVVWGTSVIWGTNTAGQSVLWGSSVCWGTSKNSGFR